MSISPRTRFLVCWLLVCLGAASFAHAQQTAFIYQSDAGDPVGSGQHGTLVPPNCSVYARYLRGGGTVMSAQYWTLTFTMPLGAVPRAGVYSLNRWTTDDSLGHLRITRPDQYYESSFEDLDGSVEIKKAIFDAQGLAALWLTCDVRYGGKAETFHAEFRWNSDSQAAGVNQAPQASFVLQDSTYTGVPVALRPAVTDDGLPAGNPLQAQWEILGAGASYGAFADAGAAATTVTFAEPGIYTLRLHVSDGEKEDVADRTIRVDPPSSRNLLHLINPPAPLKESGEVRKEPWWVFANRLSTIGAAGFQEMYDYWELDMFSGGSTLIAPGVYDAPALSSTAPRLELNDVWNMGQPLVTTKFEVRQGTRILDGDRFGAFWATFPLYGLEDNPISLAEIRYNIPPEAATGAAPVVDAGQDRIFTRLSERRLHGAAMAMDAASGAPLQTQWELVSGPGSATFTDATAPDTDVAFSGLGTYVLRLTATQGSASASDEVTIDVTDRDTSLAIRDYRLPAAQAAQYLTVRDYSFHLVSFTPDTVVIAVDRWHAGSDLSPHDHVQLEFSTGTAEPLTTKTYHDTLSSGQGGPRLAITPAGASDFFGQFAIKELQVDASGQLMSFRVAFSEFETDFQGTQLGTLPLEGELRWRADVSHDGPNLPPRVFAGPPQYVAGGLTAKMAAVFQDDILPVGRSLDLRWDSVSGPGTATADGPAPDAIVTFSKPGQYVLRYTASDGEFTASDEVTIVVGSSTQTYRGFVMQGKVILGSFQAVVLASGRFTALLNVNGAKWPLMGTFVDGEWYMRRYDAAGFATTVDLHRPADNTPISGEVSIEGVPYQLVSAATSETYLRAAQETSPYTGASTWLTQVPPPGAGPLGFNYGTARVNANGSCAFVGHLSDGKTFSYGGWVGLDGMVPLVWAIHDVELLAGPVQFARVPVNGVGMAGSLAWSRVPQPHDPRFGLGFGLVTNLLGARYHAPAAGSNPFNLQRGAVNLAIDSRADAGAPHHADRTLQPSGAVSAGAGLQMSVDPRNGLFHGNLLDAQGKSRSCGGALLQGLHVGGGNFLTASGSGVVEVTSLPPGQAPAKP